MSAPTNRVQVRLEQQLADWVAERADLTQRAGRPADSGNINDAARADITLLRELCALELGALRWTPAELGVLADVVRDRPLHDGLGAVLAHALSRAFAQAPGAHAAQWGIEEDALLRKVTSLGPAADYAARVALARYWAGHGHRSAPEVWAALGFTVQRH